LALVIVEADTVAAGVKIPIKTGAAGATYDNESGVALYKEDGDNYTLVAKSANDGTVFNTAGLIEIDFATPVNITAGNYYIGVLSNISGGTGAVIVTSGISADFNYNFFGSSPNGAFITTQSTFPTAISKTAIDSGKSATVLLNILTTN
jgi:hypothetical protein